LTCGAIRFFNLSNLDVVDSAANIAAEVLSFEDLRSEPWPNLCVSLANGYDFLFHPQCKAGAQQSVPEKFVRILLSTQAELMVVPSLQASSEPCPCFDRRTQLAHEIMMDMLSRHVFALLGQVEGTAVCSTEMISNMASTAMLAECCYACFEINRHAWATFT